MIYVKKFIDLLKKSMDLLDIYYFNFYFAKKRYHEVPNLRHFCVLKNNTIDTIYLKKILYVYYFNFILYCIVLYCPYIHHISIFIFYFTIFNNYILHITNNYLFIFYNTSLSSIKLYISFIRPSL